MLAEALSQERQQIRTREKAQAQVRVFDLVWMFSFFMQYANTCVLFRCCRKQKES